MSSSTSSDGRVATSWRSRLRAPCGTAMASSLAILGSEAAVTWSLADRCILIAGQRGDEAFEEALA